MRPRFLSALTTRITSGCSKRLPSMAAASEEGKRILSHPAHPELLLAALARWYVEALCDTRTMLESFCSILRLADRYGAPFGI